MDYPDDATFYVRLSLVQPKEGADEQISAMQDDLLQFFATQPGYVRGYKLVRKYPDPRIGRISVWQSERDADNAANAQHVLSVRSELLRLIEDEPQIERSYTAYDPQLATAAP
jgi:hypothetical protein